MKRFSALLIALCLCAGLLGCQNTTSEVPTTQSVAGQVSSFEELLCNYVIENGHYDEEEKQYYIEKQVSADEYNYIIVKDGQLRFWNIASYKTANSSFYFSFECSFKKAAASSFKFEYMDSMLSNGYPIGGTGAQISGLVKKSSVTIQSESCVGSSASEYQRDILSAYNSGIAFMQSIMDEANIPVLFEQTMKLT